MALNFQTEVAQVRETLTKIRVTTEGKAGKQVQKLLQQMELQLGMLAATSEKIKVAIEARDITIHHLGEQLMELRSRDDKPFYMDVHSDSKKDPTLYRPGMRMSREKRESLEKDLYHQMATLSLNMGGAHALGISEADLDEKIKEVAANMKKQAEQEALVRKKCISIIEQAYKNKVPSEKTTEFLLKKKVPITLIKECFSEFEDSLSFDGSDEEDFSDEPMPTTPSLSAKPARSYHSARPNCSTPSFKANYSY